MISKFINFTDEEIQIIISYVIKNYKLLVNLFYNLNKYTHDNKFFISNKKHIELFNNIPVPEKYKLKLPKKIFRGMALSDKIIKETVIKFKKEKKKLNFKPIKQFAGWSFDKNIANSFSKSGDKYMYGLVFQSTVTNKNNFLDINLFYCIVENINNFLASKYDSTKLSKEESKLFELSADTKFRYKEQEVLVFDKLKVENIYKSK